jgi:hypothetical protein
MKLKIENRRNRYLAVGFILIMIIIAFIFGKRLFRQLWLESLVARKVVCIKKVG